MKKQFEFIQAIRGIAAVLVVYFHTGHSPKFGAFGVDIFFVLSGAVMAMLMAQGPSGPAFLGRRLARIFPLYFLATTAAYVVSCLLPSARTSGNVPTLVDYLKSIAFIPHEARNGEIVPVLGVGWTLNYEMAFYLCCALTCYIATRHRPLWAGLITIGFAASLGAVFHDSAPGKFYSNPIIAEFIAGLCVWSICSRVKISLRGALWILICAALIGFMSWSEWSNFTLLSDIGSWGRPARYLIPASLLIALGFLAEPACQRIHMQARRMLVLIGDASYAIYLTHVFVISAASLVFAKVGSPAVSTGLGASVACFASIVAGVAIYRWVEVPVQKLFRPANSAKA